MLKLQKTTVKVVALSVFVSIFTPFVAFAQASTVQGLIVIIGNIIRLATPVVVGLALLYFFWGLAKFILRADDEVERAKGKQIMIWGILALFVILTIFGIITVLQNTFISNAGPGINIQINIPF